MQSIAWARSVARSVCALLVAATTAATSSGSELIRTAAPLERGPSEPVLEAEPPVDSPTTRPERRKPAELRVGSAPTPPPGFTASSISELIRRPVYADARAGIGSVVVARDGERTTLRSGLAGDLFGHAAAIIPDVNGDGVEDVAVGAPLSDIGATDTGAAYVLDGATGRPLARMRGGRGSLLGRSIAPAGDFDGDGRQDLAIGAVSFTDGMIDAGSAGLAQGELWIYSTDGRPLARFRSRYLMDAFGRDVVSIGDHNQDGFDDLAVLADAAIDRTEDAAGDRIYIIPGGPARKNVQDADEAASTLLDPRTLIGTAIASDEVTPGVDPTGTFSIDGCLSLAPTIIQGSLALSIGAGTGECCDPGTQAAATTTFVPIEPIEGFGTTPTLIQDAPYDLNRDGIVGIADVQSAIETSDDGSRRGFDQISTLLDGMIAAWGTTSAPSPVVESRVTGPAAPAIALTDPAIDTAGEITLGLDTLGDCCENEPIIPGLTDPCDSDNPGGVPGPGPSVNCSDPNETGDVCQCPEDSPARDRVKPGGCDDDDTDGTPNRDEDDNGDGELNKNDCESDLYEPDDPGSGPPCDCPPDTPGYKKHCPDGDEDGDGDSNKNDCDSELFDPEDPESGDPCACEDGTPGYENHCPDGDHDNDGKPNKEDCQSYLFQGDPCACSTEDNAEHDRMQPEECDCPPDSEGAGHGDPCDCPEGSRKRIKTRPGACDGSTDGGGGPGSGTRPLRERDSNINGIPDHMDCDSIYYEGDPCACPEDSPGRTYARPGGCDNYDPETDERNRDRDDDGDGIPNHEDCDSPYYEGDPCYCNPAACQPDSPCDRPRLLSCPPPQDLAPGELRTVSVYFDPGDYSAVDVYVYGDALASYTYTLGRADISINKAGYVVVRAVFSDPTDSDACASRREVRCAFAVTQGELTGPGCLVASTGAFTGSSTGTVSIFPLTPNTSVGFESPVSGLVTATANQWTLDVTAVPGLNVVGTEHILATLYTVDGQTGLSVSKSLSWPIEVISGSVSVQTLSANGPFSTGSVVMLDDQPAVLNLTANISITNSVFTTGNVLWDPAPPSLAPNPANVLQATHSIYQPGVSQVRATFDPLGHDYECTIYDDHGLTAHRIDLSIDSNNNHVIEAGVDDSVENGAGKTMVVNDDDDNMNGVPDLEESGSDPDLVPMVVETTGAYDGALEVFTLSYNSALLNVWTDAARTTRIAPGSSQTAPLEPMTVYVEALQEFTGPATITMSVSVPFIGDVHDSVVVSVEPCFAPPGTPEFSLSGELAGWERQRERDPTIVGEARNRHSDALLSLNLNDSDENGTLDNLETGTLAYAGQDPQILPLQVSAGLEDVCGYLTNEADNAQWSIGYDAQHVRIWTDTQRTQSVNSGQLFTLGMSDTELAIEGRQPGTTQVTLTVTFNGVTAQHVYDVVVPAVSFVPMTLAGSVDTTRPLPDNHVSSIVPSHPSPEVTLDVPATITAVPAADFLELQADIAINGQVTDLASSILQGDLGEIDTVNVYLNGEPLDQSASSAEVVLSNKQGGRGDRTPFTADYAISIPGARVAPGVNTLTVIATNGLGLSGSAERTFTVTTYEKNASLEIDLSPSLNPTGDLLPGSLEASLTITGSSSTETRQYVFVQSESDDTLYNSTSPLGANATLRFDVELDPPGTQSILQRITDLPAGESSAAARALAERYLERVILGQTLQIPPLDPDIVEAVTVHLDDPDLIRSPGTASADGIAVLPTGSLTVTVVEDITEPGGTASGRFRGDADPRADWAAAEVSTDAVTALVATDGGSFHLYAFEISDLSPGAKLWNGTPGIDPVTEFSTVLVDGRHLVSLASTPGTPFLTLFTVGGDPSFDADFSAFDDESWEEILRRMTLLANRSGPDGFAWGFKDGLFDSGEQVAEMVASGVQFVIEHGDPAQRLLIDAIGPHIQLLAETGDPQLVFSIASVNIVADGVLQAQSATGNIAKYARLGWNLREDAPDIFAITVLGADPDSLALSEDTRVALALWAVVMDELDAYLDTLDAYEAGRVSGLIFGEIVKEVVIGAGVAAATGGIGNAARAAQVVRNAATSTFVTRKLRWLDDSFDLLALGRGADRLDSIATSRMCFPAGTPIWTDRGLVPIEAIAPGMMVLSRNAATGEQGYKPVAQTFETRPDELFVLTYETSDGEIDRVRTTGEHPFYVEEQEAFVPARELAAGMTLALAEFGSVAFITDIRTERGPPAGEAAYTTYNFEVADWHTYFIADHGIWVHNRGQETCEKLAAIGQRLSRTAGSTYEDKPYLFIRDTVIRFRDTRRAAGQPGLHRLAVANAILDTADKTFRNPPRLPSGQIDFDRISYRNVRQQLDGILRDPEFPDFDVEVHHTAVKQWVEWIYRQRYGIGEGTPLTPAQLADLDLDGMPGLPMPRRNHNFGVGLPGSSTFHDILGRVENRRPENADTAITMLLDAYRDMGNPDVVGHDVDFDFESVRGIMTEWLGLKALR